MTDFLLEIYGEEIPSSAQFLIEKSLQNSFKELFETLDVGFEKINSFSTSRRVVLLVRKLAKVTPPKVNESRGPRVDANENAINGFLKSNNIKDIKKLKKKEINEKLYFILIEKSNARKVNEILEHKVPEILRSIKWSKSMRWGNNNDRWIRPIKNIMCVFDKKVVKFEFAGLSSNSHTFGNYHYNENKIKFTDFKTLKKELKKNRVILDRDERKKLIKNKLEKYCLKNNLILDFNEPLIERVANSIEYPNIFFGSFTSNYFKLPEFLIENILSDKQDYFSFRDKQKKLTNKFSFVSNIDNKSKDRLVKGNQNVLKARFSDAKFFIEEDKRKTMNERIDDLKNITFYEKTGSLFDRSHRIKDLVVYIYRILGAKLNEDENYILLSNADLSSELVKEFPSLQGKVGGFYALDEGIPKNICSAISNQYDYEFTKSNNDLLTFVLSISQKFDSIVAYFISKKKISGSGDPFGVRRLTLSIIKICIEKKIKINFFDLFSYLSKIYCDQKINIELEYKLLDDFFKKRILILFSELGFRQDIIRASLSNDGVDPYLVYERVSKLTNFKDSKDGKNFLKAFKRLDSLTEKMKNQNLQRNILVKKEELDLYKLLNEIVEKIQMGKKDFIFHDLEMLKRITKSLNQFFDNVTVNVSDEKTKQNRKILINKFHSNVNSLYNFSSLEI